MASPVLVVLVAMGGGVEDTVLGMAAPGAGCGGAAGEACG